MPLGVVAPASAAAYTNPNISSRSQFRSVDHMLDYICEPMHRCWIAFCGSDRALQGARTTWDNTAYSPLMAGSMDWILAFTQLMTQRRVTRL